LLLAASDKTTLKVISFDSRQDGPEQARGPEEGPLVHCSIDL